MNSCKLKDGELRMSYNLEFIKATKKVGVYIFLSYESYDGYSSINDECSVNALKVNEDILLDNPSTIEEMVLCRIDADILQCVKGNLKKVLSKVDIESDIDSYSIKYIIRVKISYDGDKCVIGVVED